MTTAAVDRMRGKLIQRGVTDMMEAVIEIGEACRGDPEQFESYPSAMTLAAAVVFARFVQHAFDETPNADDLLQKIHDFPWDAAIAFMNDVMPNHEAKETAQWPID